MHWALQLVTQQLFWQNNKTLTSGIKIKEITSTPQINGRKSVKLCVAPKLCFVKCCIKVGCTSIFHIDNMVFGEHV